MIALLALVATGCSLLNPAASVTGRTFLSTRVTENGAARDLVGDTRIRMTFGDDGNLGVNAGCNTMGGTFKIANGVLELTGAGMTEMACEPDLMDQDEWVFAFLGAEPRIELAGNDLVLSAGGVVIRLLDREIAEPDVALVGPTWTLVSIVARGAVSSVPEGVTATLVFGADGRVAIATGCNTGGATYRVDGTTLRFDDLVTTKKACASPAGDVEAAVLAVLRADSVTFGIDASRLALRSGAGGLDFGTETG